MRPVLQGLLIASPLALLCAMGSYAPMQGVRLKAGGKVIDEKVGHFVPCVLDWNGDGKKDLVTGQFSGGKIRLYLNRGTDAAPKFTDFEYLEAGGKQISLPAG